MNQLTKEDALATLRPYVPTFRTCIQEGWDEYASKNQSEQIKYEIRTRAGLIRDYAVYAARREFYNIPGAQIIEKRNGLFLVQIQNKLRIRFKKLGEDYSTSNINTSQNISLLYQEELFPEYDVDATYLNAGYIVSPTWENLTGIYISCPFGNSINWVIDLQRDVNELTSTTDDMNLIHRINESESTKPRIVPKEDLNRKAANNGEEI